MTPKDYCFLINNKSYMEIQLTTVAPATFMQTTGRAFWRDSEPRVEWRCPSLTTHLSRLKLLYYRTVQTPRLAWSSQLRIKLDVQTIWFHRLWWPGFSWVNGPGRGGSSAGQVVAEYSSIQHLEICVAQSVNEMCHTRSALWFLHCANVDLQI